MPFQELDPAIAHKCLEGFSDELSTEAKSNELLYRAKSKCPRCGNRMSKELNAKTAFDGDHLVPRALLRCNTCRLLLDPFSNIVLEVGSTDLLDAAYVQMIAPERT